MSIEFVLGFLGGCLLAGLLVLGVIVPWLVRTGKLL